MNPDRTGDAARRDEIATGLAGVRDRIHAACEAAGRDPGEDTLIAVTKTYPADDVRRLADLGVLDVGENRDQEAAGKAAAVAAAGVFVRWHFIGQLQRNKARSVAGYADLVHSVDSVRLAGALNEASRVRREHPLDVLVQINLDGDPRRGGAFPAGGDDPERDLARVVAEVAAADRLRLRGVMTVAPVDQPAAAFAELARHAELIRRDHPAATLVSAGMSGDLELAVRHGATHVRVGSAILGGRAPLRYPGDRN